MSSDVFFTPLWGANSEGAVCFLLEVDGCRLLLDCGWSESFDPDLLDPLAKLIEFVLA
jgi:cleavage and polyadenylation specificity factor subunit 2